MGSDVNRLPAWSSWRDTGLAARSVGWFVTATLAIAWILFIAIAYASLDWQLDNMATYMIVAAAAMDRQNLTPYLDLIDHHPPAALAAYAIAGRVFGYTLNGARLADFAGMALTLGAVCAILRVYGARVVLAAVPLAGLAHMRSLYMLEREAIALIPMLWGVAALTTTWPLTVRAGLAGVLFGVAPWIKPTLAVAAPFVLGWIWWSTRETDERGSRTRAAAAFAGGTLASASVAVAYLAASGSLTAFAAMAVDMWPVYGAFEDGLSSAADARHAAAIVLGGLMTSGPIRWLVPAALAWFVIRRGGSDAQRHVLTLLAILSASFLIYPLLGHMRPNEWMPLQYLLVMMSSTVAACLARPGLREAIAALALVAVLGRYTLVPDEFLREINGSAPHSPELIENLALAEVLRARGEAARRVQPLDYGEGALAAMVAAGSRLATSFLWDPPYESSPYVDSLRRRLASEIKARPPDVMIWSAYSVPHDGFAGNDTYVMLSDLMKEYRLLARTSRLVAYERVTPRHLVER